MSSRFVPTVERAPQGSQDVADEGADALGPHQLPRIQDLDHRAHSSVSRYLYRSDYNGMIIRIMVRLPLTPAEIERGQRLGALLRAARAERSILEVALDAGMSPETLRKVETGRIATPAFATVASLAGVLGLSLDALWTQVDRPTRARPPGGTPDQLAS